MRTDADNDHPVNHKPDWKVIAGLWPYLMAFRGRVILAAGCLVIAKLATPVVLKYILDDLDAHRDGKRPTPRPADLNRSSTAASGRR